MDPNAALARIREILADDGGDLNELAETVQGLDEWLSKGGFLPTDWSWNGHR